MLGEFSMRESFLEFRNKFARFSHLSRNQVAVLAPIVYTFDDKYYSLANKYLDKGEEENLYFDEYSVAKIKMSMRCSYLEALVILSSMEKMPEYACYIYSPRIVE